MEDTRIIDYKNLSSLVSRFGSKSIVLVGGCFDVFHIGHLTFLTRAKQLGEVLVVILESDEFIRKIKQRQPVHTLKQRALILSELRCIDGIITLPHMIESEEYEKITHTIHPSIIAVTKGDPKLILKKNQVESIGGAIMEIDYIPGFSSTLAINNL